MTATRNAPQNFTTGEPVTEDFTLDANGDATSWVLFTASVAIQFYGDATAMNATIQRSPLDPAVTTTAAEAVDTSPITGNPSTGIPALVYLEPGAAWWRVVLNTKTGATVGVSLSGMAAKK